MPNVELTDQEWQHLLALIGNNVVWAQANPLLMKIGEQLRRSGNSQEVPVPQPHFESKTKRQ